MENKKSCPYFILCKNGFTCNKDISGIVIKQNKDGIFPICFVRWFE